MVSAVFYNALNLRIRGTVAELGRRVAFQYRLVMKLVSLSNQSSHHPISGREYTRNQLAKFDSNL